MKIIVYHSYYGCDTGCCGHTVEIQDDDGKRIKEEFAFDHPSGEDVVEFAKRLIKEEYGEDHVKDLDWEHCIICTDCEWN